MAGFVLQRKDFKYRNTFSFFIYFTTLFGGGLVPWYIMLANYFNLTDTYTVLIFPGLMTPFLIILMKNFIRSAVPDELIESAKIDGANDFRIYFSIVLKLAMPGIATVGLFLHSVTGMTGLPPRCSLTTRICTSCSFICTTR